MHRVFRQNLVLATTMVSALILAGCSQTPADRPQAPASEAESAHEDTGDSQASSTEDALAYNLRRLADRDYTDTYGDGDNEKIWYSAAENLGEIGKPAIPALIEKLQSQDDYEVMLALYALQLASQDEALAEQIDNDYLRLPSVLNPRANDHNRAIALSWWEQYKHVWTPDDDS